jgi:poly-gamma-glutamate capsule biosynthesis protein CapA/YwtB (metallophosphatase superfamily)
MRQVPPQHFIDFAHAIMDAGADIFHGHSAHVVQGIEVYNGKLILYDTGDFVDDYMVTPSLRNDLSFLYLVDITKNGLYKVTLIPTMISNRQVSRATGSDAAWVTKTIKELSAPFDTQFTTEGDSLTFSYE